MEEKDFLKWAKIKAALAGLKNEEMELRKKLVADFANESKPGAYHKMLGNFKFTATIKRNYNVDKEVLDQIWPTLSEDEQECIRLKPELKLKEFKALLASPPKTMSLVHAVKETPAAPSLAVKLIEKEE